MHNKVFSDHVGSILYTTNNDIVKEYQMLIVFNKQLEDIIWNGNKWRGGTGTDKSPGANDILKNVYIMPGLDGKVLDNSSCKNLKIFKGAKLNVPNGIIFDSNN